MHMLFAIAINTVRLIVLPWLLYRRWRGTTKGTWLTVRANGSVAPLGRASRVWDGSDKALDLHALHEAAAIASKDDHVAGLLVELRGLQGGSATAMALRDALRAWRTAGKRVIVHLPRGAGARQLIAASAADRIIAAPGSEVAPMGFVVEAPYVKGALDRLGLQADVLAQGRYKTAGEFLVAEGMSEPQREQVGRLLDVAWDHLIDALSQGRSVTPDEAKRWVDEGPWLASEAKEQGIVDDVMYAEDLLRELGPKGEEAPTLSVGRYLRRHRALFRPLFRPRRIAVVEVRGAIVSDQPTEWLPMAVESHVCDALRAAREAPWVRGVVVFVDSRGGSASASERMLHEVRRLAKDKPVIACLGDTAASGGYMVAVGTHAIVSQPTTVTGSIGVVSARLVASKLLERVGIRVETVKRGAHADMMSATRALDAGERASLASGRVWSGEDALERGLVDRLGGFETALEEVRKRIGPGAQTMVPVLIAPRKVPSLPTMLRGILEPASVGAAGDLAALSTMGGDRVWAWSPWAEGDG
jgi:protease-4